jgi:glucokinase
MILSADFGGTTIKYGLVRDGRVIARGSLDACASFPMSNRLETLAVAWELLLAENAVPLHDCKGVALALPFLVDAKRPRVHGDFGKFPGAGDIDFDVWCLARLGLPVVLENDGRMALLGELTSGAAQGKRNVVMLTFGTGIACAAVFEGRLLRGANNRAATLFGHITIALENAVGRCGNIGCAEDLASTATLPVLARARHDFLGSVLNDAGKIDYKTIFECSSQGDACSLALVEQSIKVWAVLVQNAVLAYDPELVVLGGGILRSREIILPSIARHLRIYMPAMSLEIPLVAAELGDDAALIGGETLFNQNHPAQFS